MGFVHLFRAEPPEGPPGGGRELPEGPPGGGPPGGGLLEEDYS